MSTTLWFASRARLVSAAVTRFVAAPASARPLAVLRIGLSVVLLVQALAVAGSLLDLYGQRGLVTWDVSDGMVPVGVPHVRWLAAALAPLGLDADAALRLTFLAYVAGLGCLLVGWRTRPAALVAWLTHVMLNNTGNSTIYGVDQFADIALFYCAWMPVADVASLDRLTGRTTGAPSAAARVALRVLQLHLCVVYLASGIEKGSGAQWWNGEAIWRALMWPDFAQLDWSWLAHVPWLPILIGWSTLVVEGGYAVMIWPRRTRKLWALATIGMHVGIGLGMGLASFAAVMIVLNVAAFLVPAEPAQADTVAGPAGTPQCSGIPISTSTS